MHLFEQQGARFSDCGQYRYALWRIWGEGPLATFVMLNPSTADEATNDPTVERCERRARAMGFDGVRVANIFALRSTDPRVLYGHPDPVGPLNDAAIMEAVRDAGMVICAWGGHGNLHGRGQAVGDLLRQHGLDLHCLAVNADGTPQHPLYIGYEQRPKPWKTSTSRT